LIEHYVPLVMHLCDRIAVAELSASSSPWARRPRCRNTPPVVEAYLGDST